MKNLHIPTILVTLGLVGLVAVLSGQSTVGTPRVVVHNPLGVPGWVPSGVWMARWGYDPAAGTETYQDYAVPAGHFALIGTSDADRLAGTAPYSGIQVDEGSGFYFLTGRGSVGRTFEPGIVVDAGTIIRAHAQSTQSGQDYAYVVTGYVIPK